MRMNKFKMDAELAESRKFINLEVNKAIREFIKRFKFYLCSLC